MTKIILVIALAIAIVFGLKFWLSDGQNTTSAIRQENKSNDEMFSLSEGYDQPDDLTDITVNELREKGVEFIYQMLLKNQVRIEDLSAQIQELKSEIKKYKNREKIVKMVLSYVDLRDKIFTGKNFDVELKSFEALSTEDEILVTKITKLKPSLAHFPTPKDLQQDFAKLIPEMIVNKKLVGDESTIARIRSNILRLVVIRKIDEKDPQTIDSAIVRIEKSLKQESYQDALSAALALPQNYHEILKNFLVKLNAVLEVRQVDQEILNHLRTLG